MTLRYVKVPRAASRRRAARWVRLRRVRSTLSNWRCGRPGRGRGGTSRSNDSGGMGRGNVLNSLNMLPIGPSKEWTAKMSVQPTLSLLYSGSMFSETMTFTHSCQVLRFSLARMLNGHSWRSSSVADLGMGSEKKVRAGRDTPASIEHGKLTGSPPFTGFKVCAGP